MRIYGLKNCDNCRKAMKAFPHAELVDVRVQGVPPEVLDRALEQFGAALLNTRSTTWRGLDAVEREREPKDLLVDHPAVMKRPLIDTGETLFLSWNKGIQDEINSML